MNPQDPYGDLSAYSGNYGYEREKRRGLGGWVMLALAFSVLVHLALFYTFNVFEVQRVFSGDDEAAAQEMRERIHIDPELLKEQMAVQEIPEVAEVAPPDIAAIDKELDLLEVQEQLPEKEVVLTPDVEQAENYLAELGAPQEAITPVSMIDALEVAGGIDAAALEQDISRIKKRIAERGAVSENQLMLDASDLADVPGFEEGDLLDQVTAGAGTGDPVDGFNSLDGLLARTGQLPQNLDPVLLPTDLLFGYNEEEVKESARLSLMKLGMLIQKNPDSAFIIEGHTDGFGGEAFNQALSERRAEAVKRWLVESLRLPGEGIQTRGAGSSRPLAPHSGTVEEQGINRRVEIIIRPK